MLPSLITQRSGQRVLSVSLSEQEMFLKEREEERRRESMGSALTLL